MKKSLFLLPLLAGFVLAGCEFNIFGKTFQIGGNKESGTHQNGNGTGTGTGTGGNTSTGGNDSTGGNTSGGGTVVDGTKVGEVSGEALVELAGIGYSGCAGDHTVGSYSVNFNGGVQINKDPASKKAEDFPVIQFAKVGHDKYQAGVMTVSNVTASKAVVTAYLAKSSYKWSSTQIGSVSFAGKNVSVPSTATAGTTSYNSDASLQTVILNLGSGTGNFVIENTNSFAVYIVSVAFYA